MWSVLIYHSFGTGYFKAPRDIERKDWNRAKARAQGYIAARVQGEYAKVFKWCDEDPPAYSLQAPVVFDQALVDDITDSIVRNLRASGFFSRR